MTQRHLVEFEDLGWWPSAIRDLGTDWLQYVSERVGLYEPVLGKLEALLAASAVHEVVDLCSGAGGGWASILRALDARGHGDVRVRLTDLFPNARAAERLGRATRGRITYAAEPVDALTLPHELPGIRTMLLSLHHFRPADAKRILQRAVDGGHSIAIFDAPGRGLVRTAPGVTLPVMLAVSLLGNAFFPLLVLLMTPFVRPFRWSRLLLTYLIPIVPLYVWWDAAVSALRAYSLDELQQLTQELEGGTRFIWEIGRAGRRGPLGISYLIGYPRPNGDQQAAPAADGQSSA